MRSRYSAYVMKRTDYPVTTTHPDRRKQALAREITDWAAQVEFIGLEILSICQGGPQE